MSGFENAEILGRVFRGEAIIFADDALMCKDCDGVKRVRELHKPDFGDLCSDPECCQNVFDCAECGHLYPCHTIQALEGETK